VNDWVAVPAELVAVKVIGNVPAVEGVPLSTPVAAVNVTPPAKVPASVMLGVGVPVAVTVNEPTTPTVKVAPLALVNAGGMFTPVVPVPLSDVVCVPAPSWTCNAADFAPELPGLKVTLIGQLPLAARELPQVLVCAKVPGFIPPIPIELIESGPMPVFNKVTTCAALVVPTTWLPNDTVVGLRDADGATPTPERGTLWLVAGLATVIARFADLLPVALGVNVTVILQLALMARVAGKGPQVFVWAKLTGLVPLIEMPLICSGAVPGLDRVTVCAGLDVPACSLGNESVPGETLATGSTPVPLSDTVCEATGAANATVRVAAAAPAAVGLNVALNVQLAPVGSFLPLQFAPATNGSGAVAFVIVTAVVPVFFTVTIWAALVVPTNWLPKLRVVGLMDAPWARTGSKATLSKTAATAARARSAGVIRRIVSRINPNAEKIRATIERPDDSSFWAHGENCVVAITFVGDDVQGSVRSWGAGTNIWILLARI
jgi:hypothetical protein